MTARGASVPTMDHVQIDFTVPLTDRPEPEPGDRIRVTIEGTLTEEGTLDGITHEAVAVGDDSDDD